MNLHQFRYVQEAARRNLNLTDAAKALHTSQPGVSKAIIELEEELGIEIFARHGKRLKRITEPGQEVLKAIDAILREVSNLRRIGDEFAAQDAGTLSIAATHTQARYVLPKPIAALREKFEKVHISLHQGAPEQVARMLLDDVAEVGIATESLADYPDLITLPCYTWQHMLVLPTDHALAKVDNPSLAQLAKTPLITYHPSFTGRGKIDKAFERVGLKPKVVLEAIDSDVIKTYVRVGMGVGVVAEMSVSAQTDPDLVIKPAGTLFGINTTRIAFKRGAYLRNFVYEFAQLLNPQLDRKWVERAMAGMGEDYNI
jgi:LysR family cys regulon transcriptional activator